jgi:hypothetical protein
MGKRRLIAAGANGEVIRDRNDTLDAHTGHRSQHWSRFNPESGELFREAGVASGPGIIHLPVRFEWI